MIRRARALLATGLVLGSTVGGVAQSAQPIGADGWRQDLAFLAGTIKAVHPRPFHRVPEAAFDSAVAALERRLPRLSDAEAAAGLIGLVALINDGHTSLQPGGKVFPLDHWYPVRIDRLADGYFVIATTPGQRELLGAQVVRVGGRPIEVVWDSITSIAPGDNRFSRMARVPFWMMIPELMTALGFGQIDGAVLEVRIGGRTRTVELPVVPGAQTLRLLFDDVAPGDSSLGLPALPVASRDFPFRWTSDAYWFQSDPAGRLLYAQINRVMDADRSVHVEGDTVRLTLGQFGQRLLAAIDSGKAEKLVIDLRQNPGGNNFLIRPLVDGLAARPAINRRGRLFVITGRRTYSAAMNLTSLLEDRTAAIFVGEPPGGSPSHYGDATGFELPASRLRLNVSTLHWDLGVRPNDVREEQEPEIAAPPTMSDRIRGVDGALGAIRAWQPGTSPAEVLTARYRSAGMDSAVGAAKALIAAGPPEPWSSRVQQLVRFGRGVIEAGGSGPDIYRAYRLATELYPDSPYAWFELGRVYQFGRRAREAADAFARARALRPTHDLIGRSFEAARRQAAAN